MAYELSTHLTEDQGHGRPPGPVLAVGCGGSGVLTVTYLKAIHLARKGNAEKAVKYIGLDVIPEPPTANFAFDLSFGPAQLLAGVEYLQLGKGCSPPALRAAARNGQLDLALAQLVNRQPGLRLTKSLVNGTEGERLYGAIGYIWSRVEVRKLISSALTELNDLQLDGEPSSGAAPLIFIVASLAGGVGAGISLLVAADIKSELSRLGIEPSDSTILGVSLLPENFPDAVQRLSNTADTLMDYDYAQKEGVLPW